MVCVSDNRLGTQRDGASLRHCVPRRSLGLSGAPHSRPEASGMHAEPMRPPRPFHRPILGSPDDIKLRSSMTLFEAVSGDRVFRNALDRIYAGARDPATLAILKKNRHRKVRRHDRRSFDYASCHQAFPSQRMPCVLYCALVAPEAAEGSIQPKLACETPTFSWAG